MDEEFIRRLNDRLPKTRLIGHGLIRDEDGRVLLCELTYKNQWDLPGGVVELGESPRAGCLREVREELGLLLRAKRLLAMNWLPPWSGWDDAVVFLFDLGIHPASLVDTIRYEPHEVREAHWVVPGEVGDKAPAATAGLIEAVLAQGRAFADGLPGTPLYLEEGAANECLG